MKRKREVALPKKRDAFTAILRFMTKEDMALSVEEDRILNRWIYCDSLLRAKQLTDDEIIKKLAEDFHVSVYTARNDIYYTQQLFAKSRQLNKKYLIHLHLERIDRDIELMRSQLFKKIQDPKSGEWYQVTPDAKEQAAYAKLMEVYTYTLNSIPEEQHKDIQPPPIFQFLLAPNQVIERAMPLQEALDKADAEIMKLNGHGVYETEPDGE